MVHRDNAAKCREYYYAHREQMNEYSKKYYRNNLAARSEYHAAYRAGHRKHAAEYAKERDVLFRVSALMAYGWSCACCGEDRYEFLAIDHINGGGTKHRKELSGGNRGGHPMYQWLADNNYPNGFRVLCHNCNVALGMYGFCPHNV